jgi:hypothetical protein
MLSLFWLASLEGIPVHNFIVSNSETSALQFGSSPQLYFAAEETLERRINNLEVV